MATMASPRSNGGSTPDSHHNRLESGIVDFPISKDMALTGVWSYEPNSNGPVITAEAGALDISRRPRRNARNQSTKLSIQQDFHAQGGTVITFKVRFDTIQPATEVKLSLAGGVILRYDGSIFSYCCWDPNTEWFHSLSRASSIQVGDGKFCRVALCISPDAIHIFENGRRVGMWRTRVSSPFRPVFNWQILATDATLQATLCDILVMTAAFPPGASSPWDISFSNAPCPRRPTHDDDDDVWQIKRQRHDPFRVDMSPDGYMRISTPRLSFRNSWLFTQATLPLLSDDGILMYRLRVNAAGGSETKITLFAGLTLHISKNGQRATWGLCINQRSVGSDGEADNDSTIRVGSGAWTVVMLLYSPSTVTLFEDGVAKFSSSDRRDFTSPRAPLFHLQHLDAGTAVEVDLSHVRSLPALKNEEALVCDLKPHLVAHYQSSQAVSVCGAESSGSGSTSASRLESTSPFIITSSPSPSLDLTATLPGYETTFPAQTPFPLLDLSSLVPEPERAQAASPRLNPHVRSSTPTSTSSSSTISSTFTPASTSSSSPASNDLSYTLALWLRVERYPSREDGRANIVGPLSLRSDGRLKFSFTFEQARNSSSSNTASPLASATAVAAAAAPPHPPPPPFVSATTVPLLQWVSVIATYASEHSSLALFIDGEMDSVVYTTPTPEDLGPREMLLLLDHARATPPPRDTGGLGLAALQGRVEHLMVFNQRCQGRVARALANYHRSGQARSGQTRKRLSDVFPVTS